MEKNLLQIEFYYPSGKFKNKLEIVDSIISILRNNKRISHTGYSNIKLLKRGLLNHIGQGNVSHYQEISAKQQLSIEKIISATLKKCDRVLPIPTKQFIYVHPYFPTKHDQVFEGVMAVAVYSCVFHIFINLDKYTKKSLENTVAHELNHTIYYYYHFNNFNKYTLLDVILIE